MSSSEGSEIDMSSSSMEVLEVDRSSDLDKEKAKRRIKMVMQSLVASQDEDEVFTVLFSSLVKAGVLTEAQLTEHRGWVVEVSDHEKKDALSW
jgi:hypothetical protein